MTKSELVERLDEIKQCISREFYGGSDRVDNMFYALKYDIMSDYDDISDGRNHVELVGGDDFEDWETDFTNWEDEL